MRVRIGKTGTLIIWPFVCLVAFFTVQTALQANSRSLFAFSCVLSSLFAFCLPLLR